MTDNYRTIALANVISKLVENVILNRIEDKLLTTSHQFGFKSEHGTDMCIYVVKEIIDRYRTCNGHVYMCFLDASKAFDRVNHDILFRKLVTRGVPGYIIRILLHWYSNQTMFVKWGNALSQPFSVSNGVRQGGVLSPFLFNVYMDDLSIILSRSTAIGDTVINHLMYDNDHVLIASSSSGLQKLIDECSTYGSAHDIKYNCNTSAIFVVMGYVMG